VFFMWFVTVVVPVSKMNFCPATDNEVNQIKFAFMLLYGL